MDLIWYTSTDNTNWTTMRCPSTYKINWEDLDSNSYRSVANGNLIRNVVKRRWAKIAMSFNGLKDEEAKTILEAVNKNSVYFKFKSPAFSSSNEISFKGYVSKMETELLDAQVGWNVQFNVVQSNGAVWQ